MYFQLIKVLLANKIQFEEKNSKLNVKDSIRIFQGLFEFIEGLIVRKVDF